MSKTIRQIIQPHIVRATLKNVGDIAFSSARTLIVLALKGLCARANDKKGGFCGGYLHAVVSSNLTDPTN
jgi:hypothetical protein